MGISKTFNFANLLLFKPNEFRIFKRQLKDAFFSLQVELNNEKSNKTACVETIAKRGLLFISIFI